MAIDKKLFYASHGLKYPVVARPYTDDMEAKEKFFTKADVVAMLEELLEEFEKLDPNPERSTYYAAIDDCSNLTEQKINNLQVKEQDDAEL